MVSEKSVTIEMQNSSPPHTVVQANTKSLSDVCQKNCVSKFPVFSALSPLCGLVVLLLCNMYILTDARNFKIFLQENYAITLDSCFSFTEKMISMKLNVILISAYGVFKY